jgi:hypothetical protein
MNNKKNTAIDEKVLNDLVYSLISCEDGSVVYKNNYTIALMKANYLHAKGKESNFNSVNKLNIDDSMLVNIYNANEYILFVVKHPELKRMIEIIVPQIHLKYNKMILEKKVKDYHWVPLKVENIEVDETEIMKIIIDIEYIDVIIESNCSTNIQKLIKMLKTISAYELGVIISKSRNHKWFVDICAFFELEYEIVINDQTELEWLEGHYDPYCNAI